MPTTCPNRFVSMPTISYTLSEETFVRVEIFDVIGRKIATLVDSIQPSGRHDVVWDADDGNGCRVSSGVYICRMTAASDWGGIHLRSVKLAWVK